MNFLGISILIQPSHTLGELHEVNSILQPGEEEVSKAYSLSA